MQNYASRNTQIDLHVLIVLDNFQSMTDDDTDIEDEEEEEADPPKKRRIDPEPVR